MNFTTAQTRTCPTIQFTTTQILLYIAFVLCPLLIIPKMMYDICLSITFSFEKVVNKLQQKTVSCFLHYSLILPIACTLAFSQTFKHLHNITM
jgi:hypothetical protein